MMKLIPVILSGGSGTRLWPVSRANFPKQFCELLDETLFTKTLQRLQKYEAPLIISSKKLMTLTDKEIKEKHLSVEKVIYEPQGRNTAAAVAIACRYFEMKNATEQVCGVFSSDALITDQQAFETAVQAATEAARTGKVVVLAIKPDRIETGFGYIQANKNSELNVASAVLKFHEKPDFETAKKFVADGNYFWNAGIFIFKISHMIQLFKLHQPQLWTKVSSLTADMKNLEEVYNQLKSISFDYAVIEKMNSSELACVPCHIGWSDLGSWDVMDQIQSEKLQKVSLKAKCEMIESSNITVFSNEKKSYGVIGLKDVLMVDTKDAFLVCAKNESQKVKELVDIFKKSETRVIEDHVFEHRPWGKFEILRDETYFKSKIIQVEPLQKISYQSHAKRTEHWVIIKGEATVLLDGKEHILKQGSHILIPQGAKHRIINNSNSVVEFIEVQVGSYFGEDDIVRYQDDYGRQ